VDDDALEVRDSLCRVVAASMACGEFGPNTLLMSLVMFSNSILAIEKAPTSQPARVKGTQGAGAFLPAGSSISGVPSANTSVQ
jgi:hypothetical protein